MIDHFTHEHGLPPTSFPFSQAVRANGFVFIAGQASVDASGAIVPDTFENEVRRTLENVQRALQAAGSDLSHVVQVRVYLLDAARFGEFNALYREYFSAPFPARTTIVNCIPPTIQVEIDCIAIVIENDARERD